MFDNVPYQSSLELFRYRLIDFIDKGHTLVLLAHAIDRSYFDKEFAHHYSEDTKKRTCRINWGTSWD